MSEKRKLSMQQLLRASKMNLDEGKSISTIAKEFRCSVKTLKRNMEENNVKYTLKGKATRKPKFVSSGRISLKDYLCGLESKDDIRAIKDDFKKGMYIRISYIYMPDKSEHRLENKVEIVEVFKDFMLVQKCVGGNLIRECITFVDIYTKDIEVEIC